MTDVKQDYQRVAALDDVPPGGCLAVEVAGQPVVLVRDGDRVHALENRCPHAGAPLSEGYVEPGRVSCSWHGWTFALEDGASLDGAGVSVPCHDVEIRDGAVLVRLRT